MRTALLCRTQRRLSEALPLVNTEDPSVGNSALANTALPRPFFPPLRGLARRAPPADTCSPATLPSAGAPSNLATRRRPGAAWARSPCGGPMRGLGRARRAPDRAPWLPTPRGSGRRAGCPANPGRALRQLLPLPGTGGECAQGVPAAAPRHCAPPAFALLLGLPPPPPPGFLALRCPGGKRHLPPVPTREREREAPMEEAKERSRAFLPPFRHFATQAIHAGQEPEQWSSRAVVPPISLSTTFKQQAPGKHSGFEYSRCGNPTRDCLEKAVAALDGAKYCLAYSSGLVTVVNVAHLLKAGDTIICSDNVYVGTDEYFRKIAPDMGLKIVFVDCTKLECLEAAITPETKLVWIETPSNPMLKVIDIQGCAKIVHKQKGVILAVDNTFMSAYFQRPLALGADICMYSATKYMNGHTDVLMGLISVNDDALHEKLRFLQYAIGAVPSPFDCYLCNRGLKTLSIRMKQHFQNALAVAQFLESDPRVEKVIFPGLPSHPQFELVKRQSTGCPGMISFYTKGNLESVSTFLKSLKIFTLADSLGGFESLVEHPAIMTHASVPKADREALGITDTFVRMSVGLEDSEDLIEDLSQALKAAIPDYKIRS